VEKKGENKEVEKFDEEEEEDETWRQAWRAAGKLCCHRPLLRQRGAALVVGLVYHGADACGGPGTLVTRTRVSCGCSKRRVLVRCCCRKHVVRVVLSVTRKPCRGHTSVVLSVTRSHCNKYTSAETADIVATGCYCDILPRHSGRSASRFMGVIPAEGSGATSMQCKVVGVGVERDALTL
jgi:hypothetical protein